MIIKQITSWLTISLLFSLWSNKVKKNSIISSSDQESNFTKTDGLNFSAIGQNNFAQNKMLSIEFRAIYLLIFSFFISYLAGITDTISALFIFPYYLLLYIYYKKSEDKNNIGFLIIVFSFYLLNHKIIGFHEPVVHKNLDNLHYGYDHFVLAFIILALTNEKLYSSLEHWKKSLNLIFFTYLKMIIVLVSLSLILGFKFKSFSDLGQLPIMLIISGLIIKAFAEEAFYRMFLFNFIGDFEQNVFDYENNSFLKRIRFNNLDGLKTIVSTSFFVLFYSFISFEMALLAAFLGFGYAYLYTKTDKIEYVIFLNFITNLSLLPISL
jgi:hypothetical protein